MRRSAAKRKAERHRGLAILVVVLMAASVAFGLLSPWAKAPFPGTRQYLDEKSAQTVMLSTSSAVVATAIAAIPDDATTPVANQIMNLGVYILLVSVAITLEKLLVGASVYLVCVGCVPIMGLIGLWWLGTGSRKARAALMRMAAFSLCILFLVPASVGLSQVIETSAAMPVLEEVKAQEAEAENGTLWDSITGAIQNLIDQADKLARYAQDQLNYFMNAIVILIITNFVMPIVTAFVILQAGKAIWVFIPEDYRKYEPVYPAGEDARRDGEIRRAA